MFRKFDFFTKILSQTTLGNNLQECTASDVQRLFNKKYSKYILYRMYKKSTVDNFKMYFCGHYWEQLVTDSRGGRGGVLVSQLDTKKNIKCDPGMRY